MDDYPDVLLERLESAHWYERYISSLCPFHDDSRPSFFVYPDRYWCSACGKHGTTEYLIKHLDNFNFIHHNKDQSPFYNPFTKWLRNHEISRILQIAFANAPVKYISDRKIDYAVQLKLKIGIMDNWITFPIYDEWNKITGAVARAGEGNPAQSKYILPKGQDPNLLYVPSWSRVFKKKKVYLTYGILDAVTLYAAGYAAMSTTTGMRISPDSFDGIRKKIIIIPDKGEERSALKLAAKLGWRGSVLQLQWEDGAKDINDLLWKKNLSFDELREMINEQI